MSNKRNAQRDDDPTPRKAGDKLRSFVDRIERLETEIGELNSDKSDLYGEAKSTGFDVRALKAVIARRRKDPNELREHDAIVETYLGALEAGTGNAPPARARTKPEPDAWEDARGCAPDATGGLSSEDFVRQSRDEWPDRQIPEPAPAGSSPALAVAPAACQHLVSNDECDPDRKTGLYAGATLPDGIPPFLDRRVLST